MAIGLVASFWGLSTLFVLTPGADWAYAITAGLRHRTVVPAVVGLLSGHLVHVTLVTLGVAALLAREPAALTVLTVVGALYLLWLGGSTLVQTARTRAAGHADVESPEPTATPAEPAGPTEPTASPGQGGSWASRLGRGAAVSGLNPKVFLLLLVLLPQLTDPRSTWPVAGQLATLAAVHVATCAVVYAVVATGARAVLGARPRAARVVTRVSGGAMMAIGGVLLVEQVL